MRNNSFDALRISAALAVMVSHAWQVTSGTVNTDLLYRLSGGQLTLGALAVTAFFGMSGYLVMGSWERRPNAAAFTRARALRIWPALLLVLAVTVLLIGPALTTHAGYWTDPLTWSYWQNALLHQFTPGQRYLPGVFEHNPLPRVVDDPLWTLEFEVACYLGLLGLGLARVPIRQTVTLLAAVLAGVVWLVPGAAEQAWVYLPLAFATGAALHAWGDRQIWRRDLAVGAALLVTVGLGGDALRLLASTAGVYALLYVARRSRLGDWGRYGDPSYGIYLWGMPMQQVFVALGLGLTPVSNLLLSVPVTLLVAYGSWHLLEKRMLALKTATPLAAAPVR